MAGEQTQKPKGVAAQAVTLIAKYLDSLDPDLPVSTPPEARDWGIP